MLFCSDYYTDYNVTVVAFTSAGPGEGGTEMFRSSEGPPSAPPTMISLTRVTSQSVEFSWFPPPPGTVNGVLRSYQVEFDRTNHTVPDGTSFQRSGLSPYTNYSFRVAAVTTKVGTFSDISSVRTNFSGKSVGPPHSIPPPLNPSFPLPPSLSPTLTHSLSPTLTHSLSYSQPHSLSDTHFHPNSPSVTPPPSI